MRRCTKIFLAFEEIVGFDGSNFRCPFRIALNVYEHLTYLDNQSRIWQLSTINYRCLNDDELYGDDNWKVAFSCDIPTISICQY